jgi:co-chaperonin GroES (HSP10)
MFEDDDTLRRVEQASTPSANIEPLDDWLTIAPSSEEHETRAGLIIPASAEVPVRAGIVLAVGEEATGVTPGDKVLFPRGAAMEVRLGGEPVLLVRRRDLVARYTE